MGFKKEVNDCLANAFRLIDELNDRVLVLERDNKALKTNGVTTAVKELNTEVKEDRKETEYDNPFYGIRLYNYEIPKQYKPTLKGKVDAIVEHLGIEFNITEEKVEDSKVVAKKKKVTKKKGRR